MSIGPLYESYSSAIALNNMGVSLLERQCFSEAVETFETAVKFMKIVSHTASTQGLSQRDVPSVPHFGAGFAASTLHRAYQYLANCEPGKQGCGRHPNTLGLEFNLQVLTFGESPTGTMQEFILGDNKGNCYHHHLKDNKSMLALRIEHGLNLVERTEFLDLVQVESSVMLYNFAVAYSFKASIATDSSPISAKHLLGTAFRLAVLSCSLVQNLRRQLEERRDQTLSGDDFLPLSIIMHMTLQGLASVCASETEAVACEVLVAEMIHEFLVKEFTLIQETHINAAAAA